MTERELAERDRADVMAVFSTREGRRFFARLMLCCGIYDACVTPENCERTHEIALREGVRNMGVSILHWLQDADENAIIKLFEADKERRIDEWEKTE